MNPNNVSMPNNFPMTLVYLGFADSVLRLKLNESWRGLLSMNNGFSKEDKEALNAQIALILVPIFEKEYGIKINLDDLASYVLARIFRKSFLWDSKPANMAFLKDNMAEKNIAFEHRAMTFVKSKLIEKMNAYRDAPSYKAVNSEEISDEEIERFANWIVDKILNCDSDVHFLYKCAKALATCVEFEEVRTNLRSDSGTETYLSVYEGLEQFRQYPVLSQIARGVGKYGKVRDLIHYLSWGRFTVRWQGYYTTVRSSILTHMLETGLLGYLQAIENAQNANEPAEAEKWKQMSIKAFCVGLFHDVSEIWTDDIPSPAKDGMGIREICEKQEREALLKYFYPCITDSMKDFFNTVMLSEIENADWELYEKIEEYFIHRATEEEWDFWYCEKDVDFDYLKNEVFKEFWGLDIIDRFRVSRCSEKYVVKVFLEECFSYEVVQYFRKHNSVLTNVEEHVEFIVNKFYARLPKNVAEYVRSSGAMRKYLEAKAEQVFHKSADYFAADKEVWWNIRNGVREQRFKDILYETLHGGSRTPGAMSAVRFWLKEVEGEKFFL